MSRSLLAVLVSAAAAFVGVGRAAASDAPGLPAVLRLDDALRLLRQRGFDVLMAEAAVSSAEGDVRIAGAVANPALSLSYGRSFAYGSCTDAQGNPAPCGAFPAQYGLGVSDQGALLDVLTGKRGLRQRTARAALAAARASREDAIRSLEGQTKQTFMQVLIAQEALRFAKDVAAASTRTAELTRARYEAGAISEADLARIDVAKLEADQAVDAATQTLGDARAALAFLLGAREHVGDFRVEAPELLRPSVPRALVGVTPEALLERARGNRPDLAAALHLRDRSEAALALARRQRVPDVALSLSYAQQGTTSSAVTPPTVTVGIALPLPLFYRQQGEVQKAEADLRTQALQASKVEAQVVSDVGTAYTDYATSLRQTNRMQTALLERARRARDLVSVQYQKGAASLLDFLDAQRTFIATSVEYLQDLGLFWGSVFRLEQASGEELR